MIWQVLRPESLLIVAVSPRLNRTGGPSTFALIKELTGLTGNTMLAYKGLDRGSAYLMIASCTAQLIMYDNFTNQRELGSLQNFKVTFQ